MKLYSYLDTLFQRKVPLNYFLIHPDFDIDLGKLVEVTSIEMKGAKNLAFIECIIEVHQKRKIVVITLKSDFGGWKIEGESLFG
ncbi:hypothetical protein [Sedimentibacter sp. MB31-C6]|uniref:hypothetical protein n=1 Tax=Sedimentibacter sp. MB31-C6 TaxID=3109366 RepID=UPI002DDCB049|nr:hypothetical protein [Sedimentibacter sp. MB36-C1]WSI03286.1 hypothetical protein U8307_09535 [Sedimentibacter sp. MB36-C1]